MPVDSISAPPFPPATTAFHSDLTRAEAVYLWSKGVHELELEETISEYSIQGSIHPLEVSTLKGQVEGRQLISVKWAHLEGFMDLHENTDGFYINGGNTRVGVSEGKIKIYYELESNRLPECYEDGME